MAFVPAGIRSAQFRDGRFEISVLPRPIPGVGEILIEVHGCGICGSDLHFYAGATAAPSVCPGHEICGVVGSDSQGLPRGCPVVVEPLVACGACRQCELGEPNLCPALRLLGTRNPGGFADVVIAPASSVYPLPPGLDLDAAVIVEPLAVAVHAIEVGMLEAGMDVVVIGGGTIGLLTAFMAKRVGTNVTIAVRHPHQRAAALQLGLQCIIDGGDAAIIAATTRAQPDVVFETVGGHAATLPLALACVRPGGSVVMLGVFSRPLVLDPLALLAKEIRLVSSMMYSRKGPEPDFVVALRVLREERGRLAPLLTHHVALDEIDRGFALAGDKRLGAIKVVVHPTLAR